jgi:hypothetical protein
MKTALIAFLILSAACALPLAAQDKPSAPKPGLQAQAQMETRIYSVKPEALAKLFGSKLSSGEMMELLRARGVAFEEGSAIACDRDAGRLVVKNSPGSLAKLEALLKTL